MWVEPVMWVNPVMWVEPDEMTGVPTDMEELAIKYQKAETRLKEVETLNEELQLKLVEPLRSAGVSKIVSLEETCLNTIKVYQVESRLWRVVLVTQQCDCINQATGSTKLVSPVYSTPNTTPPES
ncbi:hypothetical protein EB796_002997 [Bugula neritina]|uniref:Uncharacterized protein n=1 Tax=Bugula neritina TaxID=10212 RepID=A0A7J7KLP8_BUGNE|nr:hypothetical protein EB796_002997 [Bugula neritina]